MGLDFSGGGASPGKGTNLEFILGSTLGFSHYQPHGPGQVIHISVIFLLLLSQSWFKIILDQILVITFLMVSDTLHGLNITGSASHKDKNASDLGNLSQWYQLFPSHSFLPDPSLRKEKVPYSS